MMLGLGLGLTNVRNRAAVQPAKPQDKLCEAVRQRVCVVIDHKGKTLTIAPHVVYQAGSADDLRLAGVEIDATSRKKPKLVTFKVADIERVEVTDFPFSAHVGFDANDPEYQGNTLCII